MGGTVLAIKLYIYQVLELYIAFIFDTFINTNYILDLNMGNEL